MATRAGTCLFRIGYFLYTRTRFGKYYFRKDIEKAKEKYENKGHTVIEPTEYEKVEITPIPVALDNYAYIILDTESNTCVVIDVGDETTVIEFLDRMNVTPAAILTTHKHWDHSGGNDGMKTRYPGIQVYGGKGDNVPYVTDEVEDKQTLQFGGLSFTVHTTPGHTVGHCVYVLDGGSLGCPDCIFSGDHLFLGGCGRMFEASPEKMLRSLDLVCRLPGESLIWPGHEYAIDNLEFAVHVDPENEKAQEKLEWAKNMRKKRLKTCPSTIDEEMTYNPFLRTSSESILKSLDILVMADEGTEGSVLIPADDTVRAQALKELRERKDAFKYIQ